MLFALALMFADQRFNEFQQIKAHLSITALPFQYVINWPARGLEWLSTSITTQQQLLEENAKLRANQLLIEAKLQKLLALESENAQLLALLQSAPHAGAKFTTAQLLAINLDPAIQQVVLDKGTKNGVYSGQPVLDAYGVMGQIIEVGPLTSRVMLISAPQSAIPVQDTRNGIRAIAEGTGYDGELRLLYVPFTAGVKQGDVLVTSGLGGRFPEGYPVGVIKTVQNDPQHRFANITIIPSAHLERSRQVLLVWPAIAKEVTSPSSLSKTVMPNKKQERKVVK